MNWIENPRGQRETFGVEDLQVFALYGLVEQRPNKCVLLPNESLSLLIGW